jgi:D-serine deaminase-like pyridoxal phosphate-dependent protein
VTEIRPGTYVFNDLNESRAGACAPEQCALRVMVTVVSTAVVGRVVVDGGSKTFSSDRLLSGDGQHFGAVTGHPELRFVTMSEEHGHLEIDPGQTKPKLGEKLAITPNHVCPCVNLHDRAYYYRNGVVEGCWTVEGRGKVQ